jgi:hypothetical protein
MHCARGALTASHGNCPRFNEVFETMIGSRRGAEIVEVVDNPSSCFVSAASAPLRELFEWNESREMQTPLEHSFSQ